MLQRSETCFSVAVFAVAWPRRFTGRRLQRRGAYNRLRDDQSARWFLQKTGDHRCSCKGLGLQITFGRAFMRFFIGFVVLSIVAAGLVSLSPDFVRYMKIRSM
jgi:hypothetical protein